MLRAITRAAPKIGFSSLSDANIAPQFQFLNTNSRFPCFKRKQRKAKGNARKRRRHRAPGTGDQESKKRAHGKRKETGERSIGDQMTRVKISDVEAWHRSTERRIHQGKRERESRRTGGRRVDKKANDRAGGQTSGSPPCIRCSLLPEKLSDKLTHACRKGVLPP